MKLVIEDEAGTRSVVPFDSDEIVVGRGPDGVTVRLSDRDVSRRHARFGRASGVAWVEDLGSLTGTRVNGERLKGRRKLREGDLVEVGDYDLALLPDPVVAKGPATPPPIHAAPATPRPARPAPAPASAAPAAPAAIAPRPAPSASAAARPAPLPAPAAAPAEPGRAGVVLLAAVTAALLGLAAGYLTGWLRLL